MTSATPSERAGNGRAIAAMLTAQASFTVNDALIKLAATDLPGGQAIFLRGSMAVVMALAVVMAMGGVSLAPLRGQWRLLGLRNVGEIGTTFCYLFALFQMPIANATAILQFIPLAITAAAAIFLAERVGWRRWLATAVGFAGVLIVMRPASGDYNAYSLLALASVGFAVLRDLSTRRIQGGVPAILLMTISALVVTSAATLFALVETWVWPNTQTLAMLAGAAVFILVGYYFMVDAMRFGEVSVVAPFRYSVIVWAILAGILIWGHWPDAATLIGTVLVTLAGLYTFLRERHLARTAPPRA